MKTKHIYASSTLYNLVSLIDLLRLLLLLGRRKHRGEEEIFPRANKSTGKSPRVSPVERSGRRARCGRTDGRTIVLSEIDDLLE